MWKAASSLSFGLRNIIDPFPVPSEWLRFRSVDWGAARPFSCRLVGRCVSDDYPLGDGRIIPRGALVRYREWYGASSPNVGLKMTAEEVARGILDRSGDEALPTRCLTRACSRQSGGPSLAERMRRVGLEGTRRGDNRRVGQAGAMGGWDQMRARIKGDGVTPMLFVFHTCRDFIRTVPALQHDHDRPEDLDTGRKTTRRRVPLCLHEPALRCVCGRAAEDRKRGPASQPWRPGGLFLARLNS